MKRTCLIVDDSSTIRKIGRRIVEELGFECVEAEDGMAALHCCQQRMPDAILLDWNMPVMNGYDFLQALRKQPQGNDPIVIFCTTENEVAKITQALSAGAQEYIMKPFDADMLRDKFVQTGLLECL